MKTHNYQLKTAISTLLVLFTIEFSAQNWTLGGNPPVGLNQVNAGNNLFGTGPNLPVRHITGNNLKFTTTFGAPLNNNIFSGANGNFSGDGISIAPGPGSSAFATLDLFTTVSNQTHIRMDGTALLQTASSRFEQYANLNGFWFNATGNNQFGTANAFNPLYPDPQNF